MEQHLTFAMIITILFDRFDTADIALLDSLGLLDEVILHEMGHVIGIGSLGITFLTRMAIIPKTQVRLLFGKRIGVVLAPHQSRRTMALELP
jgi:hypothetical protein